MPGNHQAQRDRGLRLPHLRAWRMHRALTQGQLAEKANVARSTVTRAERGLSISIPHVQDIAKALGVTPQQLRDEEPDNTKDEPAA